MGPLDEVLPGRCEDVGGLEYKVRRNVKLGQLCHGRGHTIHHHGALPFIHRRGHPGKSAAQQRLIGPAFKHSDVNLLFGAYIAINCVDGKPGQDPISARFKGPAVQGGDAVILEERLRDAPL